MKSLIVLATLMISAQSFAQDSCEKRLMRAESRLVDLRDRLATCEANAGRNTDIIVENRKLEQKVQILTQQNNNLLAENAQLRREIEDMRNRPMPQPNPYPYPNPNPAPTGKILCSAACTTSSGIIDLKYLMTGEGYTQTQAHLNATQTTQSKYSCYYGVKVVNCEPIYSEVPTNFCSAACTSSSGVIDTKYSSGAEGRNRVEAEAKALKATQSKYSCYYGVKIISCD